ncbi:S1 RNA-binding domain-containing protein [Patescibacteria group bacterium]|nr:S1 RNA-binding domain-containing protein [Patescibacteria group bacterium]
MAELLASHKSTIVTFKKGSLVKGKIIKLTPSETLVDINTKANALVLEKEKRLLHQMLLFLKVGDEVTVSILNPESDFGYPVVSLRRFMDNLVWKKLEALKEAKEKVTVTIDNKITGGYLVTAKNGISGFLPNSQVSFSENQQDLVGRKIEVLVLEISKEAHKIIFSQKAIFGSEDFDKVVKNLKTGQKVDATVTTLTPFGIFASIAGSDGKYLDGLIHISEISWEKVLNIEEMVAIGDHLEVVIIGLDKQAKRVNLSLKRLLADPFLEIAKKYTLEQKIDGTVLKATSTGLVLDLGDGAEGFIRKEKIPPTVKYEVGQKMKATVSEIDKNRRRIILTPVLLEKPIGYK